MDESIAFLSDVHGNAAAFIAVLADIKKRGISKIVNMGDVIGYGPEPKRCLDLAMENCAITLCGNHEYAVMHGAEGFNPVAKSAVDYVRSCLLPPEKCTDEDILRRWDFINKLSPYYEGDNIRAMHGSPRHTVMEYVLPSDPEMDPLKLDDMFECMEYRIAFVGHTHFPGIIEEDGKSFLTLQELAGTYEVSDASKIIVNVGSVGQPRDRDIRSCYVEYTDKNIYFRRVKYNVEATVRKIQKIGVLHESLGHRLREGR